MAGAPVRPGELDSALEERVRDPLLAVAGSDAEAPRGPHGEVVDVRDLTVAGEGRVGTR